MPLPSPPHTLAAARSDAPRGSDLRGRGTKTTTAATPASATMTADSDLASRLDSSVSIFSGYLRGGSSLTRPRGDDDGEGGPADLAAASPRDGVPEEVWTALAEVESVRRELLARAALLAASSDGDGDGDGDGGNEIGIRIGESGSGSDDENERGMGAAAEVQ